MQERIANYAAQIRDKSPQDILAWALVEFGIPSVALASSMSAEDQVLTDMLWKQNKGAHIFTLDTGRLPQETHDLIQATMRKYGKALQVVCPEKADIEAMTTVHGPNLFYESLEKRKMCCDVRKVQPLRKELKKYRAWITGLRRDQATTRQNTSVIDWDETFGLVKINPLIDWSEQKVWEYVRREGVPYNALHDQGYPSIGCAPCTRAVVPGEDIRSGRWWWESPEHKECGLHLKPRAPEDH